MNPSDTPLPIVTGPRTCVKVIKQRVSGDTVLPPEEDYLAIEDPLEIEWFFEEEAEGAKGQQMVTMRTPGHDLELIHGFLYSEGVIRRCSDIVDVAFDLPRGSGPSTRARVHLDAAIKADPKSRERAGVMLSSCGACGKSAIADLALSPELWVEDESTVEAGWIHQLPAQMHREQATFRWTGGLHAAALFAPDGALLISHEDIGRHNALDKAIGANLMAGLVPAEGQVLCVSGRMSFEILQKAILARIPIVAGVGAPSSLAVTLASDFNVTLIGFVRDGSYNIYSCPQRLRRSSTR